jgi:hypothetical protein
MTARFVFVVALVIQLQRCVNSVLVNLAVAVHAGRLLHASFEQRADLSQKNLVQN